MQTDTKAMDREKKNAGTDAYKCDACGESLKRTDNLNRHRQSCKALSSGGKHQCTCNRIYTRKDNLKRHMKSCGSRRTHPTMEMEQHLQTEVGS